MQFLMMVSASAYAPAAALAGARLLSAPSSRTAVVASASLKDISLEAFLTERANVHPKFLDKILSVCEDEMIGSVANLQIASDAGMLPDLFKPVVALSIQDALGQPPNVAEAADQLRAMLETDASPASGDAPLTGAGAYAAPLAVAQHGLEVEPYWDMLPNLPINTYKPKRPHLGSITTVKRIVGANAPGEVCHVNIDVGGKLRYWEGQSLGVKPPGLDAKTGKPNAVRLYSIASSRYGDDGAATSISLCVRRAVYWCPELKAEDPAKKGVCSNFLCDSQPGDEVAVTGPTGKVMLMPESDPMADVIMVATGTGIAPYRGFLRRLFIESTP
jgi:hypothetical protein